MISAQELRIGNWIKRESQPEGFLVDANTISRMHYSGVRDEKPMPITEDWLVKFGFENLMRKSKDGYTASGYTYRGSSISLIVYFDNGSLSVGFWQGNEKKYVHQLQNLFFALTGEELKLIENATV